MRWRGGHWAGHTWRVGRLVVDVRVELQVRRPARVLTVTWAPPWEATPQGMPEHT